MEDQILPDHKRSILLSEAAPKGTPSVPAEPSILAEYVFFPFYDYIVQFYPKSWVPNKLTLFGVGMTLLSSMLMLTAMRPGAVFEPDQPELLPASLVSDPSKLFVSPLYPSQLKPFFSDIFTPTSMLILCGALNLIYCVADNTDGRLARRDRRTSVIGEYLDHGLDCVTSLLSASIAFGVMGASLSNMSISVCLIAMVTVLSHNLHFETNVFVWGNRIATVDEAMVFFGICMWIPLLIPTVGTAAPFNAAQWEAVVSPSWAAYLARLAYIDYVYFFYNITQAQTIIGIACRKWRMAFRIQSLFVVANSLVLLACLPMHNVVARTAVNVPGYTLGPLPYPAVWIITCACSFSTIIHVSIAAKCLRLPTVNPLPLAGVVFVWIAFSTCPVGGMILAAAVHIAQVLINLSILKKRRTIS